MLKGFGAMLIAIGCIGAGMCACAKLKKRTEFIRSIIDALEFFEQEIHFKLTSAPIIIGKLASSETIYCKKFFHEVLGMLKRQDISLGEAIQIVLENNCAYLCSEEKNCISELGELLGKYDCDGQLQAIRYARGKLETILKDARSERIIRSKLYNTLGFVCAAAIIIILI